MIRTFVMAILAMAMVVATPGTAAADPAASLKNTLLNGQTDYIKTEAYQQLVVEMLAHSGRPAIQPIVTVTSVNEAIDYHAAHPGVMVVSTDATMALLHSKATNATLLFQPAFDLGMAARVFLAPLLHETDIMSQTALLRQVCYGGAAMRAMAQVLGTGPRQVDMDANDKTVLARTQGISPQVALTARDTGLADGPAACDVPVTTA